MRRDGLFDHVGDISNIHLHDVSDLMINTSQAMLLFAKSVLRKSASKRKPVLTLSVLFITLAFTCAERLHPFVLVLLRRDPVALSHYQWWRVFTPLLVQPDPWRRALMVFLLFLIVGSLSECLWKRTAWTILYLVCGLTGEIAGYFWEPYNAGMSVAGAGLLGSLAAWMILQAHSWQARVGGGFIVLCGTILICTSDIHGPPILVGAFMGTIMIHNKDKSLLTPTDTYNEGGSPVGN